MIPGFDSKSDNSDNPELGNISAAILKLSLNGQGSPLQIALEASIRLSAVKGLERRRSDTYKEEAKGYSIEQYRQILH